MTWLADLTDTEHRYVLRMLEAPSLWAFALLAGEHGLERAVGLCEHREGGMPPEDEAVLARGDYTPLHLPEPEAIRYAILGCRIEARRQKKGTDAFLQACLDLGVNDLQAARAQAELGRFRPRMHESLQELRRWH